MDPLELLYLALGSPLGLVVEVSDFILCQSKLYSIRMASGDPELARLQFRRSPFRPETEMWIVKGKKNNEQD